MSKMEIAKERNIVDVVRSFGIELQPKGNNYVGLCPFHAEKVPSFTLLQEKNRYHCFGCGVDGDVIDFVAKQTGYSIGDAIDWLVDGSCRQLSSGCRQLSSVVVSCRQLSSDSKGNGLQINHMEILNYAAYFYHQNLSKCEKAIEYLKGRGITEQSISDFYLGYCSGNLRQEIQENDIVTVSKLSKVGILNPKGNEMFYECVIFPILDDNGMDCVGVYGRRTNNEGNNHLYLPGKKTGVWNSHALKKHKSIILTESIIDAITLYGAGFQNVIPCYGVNGFTHDHIDLFKKYQTERVHICFDWDTAGNRGMEQVSRRLMSIGIEVYNVKKTPDMKYVDLNEMFVSVGVQAVDTFKNLCEEAEKLEATIEYEQNVGNENKKTLSQEVEEWVMSSRGIFLFSDVHRGLQLSLREETKNLSKSLGRLIDKKIIERVGNKNGQFRLIDDKKELIDWYNADISGNFPIEYPLGIHNYALTYPKNVVIIGGAKDAGKTAILLNIAAMNRKKKQIYFFSSEMGEFELKKRLISISEKLQVSLEDLRDDIVWVDRYGDFSDVIVPDAINIIDFLEITKDFFEVGDMVKNIFRRLTTGIAVIGIQKPSTRDMPIGGEKGLEKARIAIALDGGKAKILVGKNWAQDNLNPKGLTCEFKLVRGSEFIQTTPWDIEGEYDEQKTWKKYGKGNNEDD
ncbi:MAG: toprim domain-containing protein [Bacteroidetes bacterium]|nr:MAG: toprim domain-containing protein [Bacteroidota bacterium]